MSTRPYVDVAIYDDITLIAYFTFYSDGGLRVSYPRSETVLNPCPMWRFNEAHSFAIVAGFNVTYTVRRGALIDPRRKYVEYAA